MAKLSFRDEVRQQDVDEALKLMDFSIRSLRLLTGDAKHIRIERQRQGDDDEVAKIILQVREIWTSKSENKYMPISDIHKKMRRQFGENIDLERLKQVL